ncbi:MAG: hypothetical protein NT080_12515 [Spirochaetes bacterium]|nr:hypothetical protein [Spirochaetota bacterium]
MKDLLDELDLSFSDPGIEKALAEALSGRVSTPYGMRFSQNEEFFVVLEEGVRIPSLPIHHDVRSPVPDRAYAAAMALAVGRLASAMPEAFEGLSYSFDPTDILRPCFFRTLVHGGSRYLYMLRIDLPLKPYGARVLVPGTNDFTAEYETRRFILESELVPIRATGADPNPRIFKLMQYVSDTWIGETGKGYQVRGIWMDNDLTRFFTRVFLPESRRIHPFYPLFCKYKSICCFVPGLGDGARGLMLPFFSDAIAFLAPEMERIQAILKLENFSDALPEFVELRKSAPPRWLRFFDGVEIHAYLNEWDMKEYSFDFTPIQE